MNKRKIIFHSPIKYLIIFNPGKKAVIILHNITITSISLYYIYYNCFYYIFTIVSIIG